MRGVVTGAAPTCRRSAPAALPLEVANGSRPALRRVAVGASRRAGSERQCTAAIMAGGRLDVGSGYPWELAAVCGCDTMYTE